MELVILSKTIPRAE